MLNPQLGKYSLPQLSLLQKVLALAIAPSGIKTLKIENSSMMMGSCFISSLVLVPLT